MDVFSLTPGRARGRSVQQAMSRRLGGSLRHILEAVREPASVPDGTAAGLIAALEAGAPALPEAFAIHSDILGAVGDGDFGSVRALFVELGSRPFLRERLLLRPLNAAALSAATRDRYVRYAATDADVPLPLCAPRDDEVATFAGLVEEALAMLRRVAPELAEEFDAIVGEIVVATLDETAATDTYDAVSCFDVWGALFVNPRRHTTQLETIGVLVHEMTHALLFGYCLDEPLVLNPMSERFSSPVRTDARPMDGVFHGTYVIAMLDYLARKLLASGALSEGDREIVRAQIAQYERAFPAGIEVIRGKGRLTETGRRIIDGAEAYMSAAA
jgi:acyl-coenzyme A thioesterase PaaI-like protein